MKLYHGTSSRFLDRILKSGIKPRGKGKSQWDKFPSRPDLVYLTTAYPFYFSIQAISKKEHGLVLEIDSNKLDTECLLPDEDFIVQKAMNVSGKDMDTVHQSVWKTLEAFQNIWPKSIDELGNVAFKGVIPPEAITRYCVMDFEAQPQFAYENLEPLINLLNYGLFSEWLRGLVAWAFGDRKTWPETHLEYSPKLRASLRKEYPEQEQAIKEAAKNRKGIEVVVVNGKKPRTTKMTTTKKFNKKNPSDGGNA